MSEHEVQSKMWLEIYAHLQSIGMPQMEGKSAVERCKAFTSGPKDEVAELKEEVDELKSEVDDLEWSAKESDEKIKRLEAEIEDMKDSAFKANNLPDQQKYDLLMENFDKIPLWQLENFFRNPQKQQHEKI